MRLILDTHVFLWGWGFAHEAGSGRSLRRIRAPVPIEIRFRRNPTSIPRHATLTAHPVGGGRRAFGWSRRPRLC